MTSLAVDDAQGLLGLRCRRQILPPRLGHEDIILDAHAANGVVILQDLFVYELSKTFVLEEYSLDVVAVEVTG